MTEPIYKRISARTLLGYNTEDLWETLYQPFILVFDDGQELLTDHKETLLSSYFWNIHRVYPLTPILQRHHVSHVLKGKALTSKTHIELLGIIFQDVVHTYNLPTPASRDHLTRMVYEVTNDIYVNLIKHAEAYVVSIDALDFINIIDNPTVKPILDSLTYDRSSIDHAYTVLLDVLNNASDLTNNALARATRAKMVNANQVLQCVGPRGFLTNVDGMQIPIPVLRSYTTGMKSLYNTMVESQSAAKSLYFSESPLQDAEYFARRLQLLCMSVERLHYTDCGSTEYLLWRVKPPVESNDRVVYPGDLKFMVGKYYYDDQSGKLKTITMADRHLYGTTIKMRSVAYCKHEDHHGVCSVCFGQMADNISPNANLGHVCAATMTQQTSQSVLSTKHLDASSSSEPIALTEVSRRYFTVGRGGSTYLFSKELKDKKISMVVSQAEAFGLTDIMIVPNVEDINPSRISEIDFVGFELQLDDSTTEGNVTPVCVSQNGRYAMLTHEFLKYLKLNKWNLDNRGNFVFDLQYWDYTKPVLRLPEMEYSFSLHSHQIAVIIESRMKEISDRMKPDSPASTLVELFDLVNSKLNVNIALLEVILYAIMIRDGENGDFGLARNSTTRSLGVADLTIKNRSLSAAMAYEDQATVLVDPKSFYEMGRPDSLFDCFIAPREVVQDRANDV